VSPVVWVAAASGVVAGALLWLRYRFVVIDVAGDSMEPTYRAGDQVLVRRSGAGGLRDGDVVVVEVPARSGRWSDPPSSQPVRRRTWMIKRVAARPGDPVPATAADSAGLTAGAPVPPGFLVVLGDNVEASFDSRTAGLVPVGHLLGVVVRRMRN
jgi:signal peptidase I